jgi:hypothetical protein
MRSFKKIRDEMAIESEKIIICGYGCPEVSLKECANYISKKSFDSGFKYAMEHEAVRGLVDIASWAQRERKSDGNINYVVESFNKLKSEVVVNEI